MSTLIEVRCSPIHGNGVFALAAIPAGSLVTVYRGEMISRDELERRIALRESEGQGAAPIYYFEIEEDRFIDAGTVVEDNPARFINHACDENCEAIWNAKTGRMEIFALRDIAPGEELSFDYGFELTGFFEHPCRCASEHCCGYIVAKPLRAALMKKLARHARAKAARMRTSNPE